MSKGDIRCVDGRKMRHDPQHDDPYLETDVGKCEECDGDGCEALAAEIEHDDAIDEAIYDGVCDGEGKLYARYLRHHLAKHGLKIAPIKGTS